MNNNYSGQSSPEDTKTALDSASADIKPPALETTFHSGPYIQNPASLNFAQKRQNSMSAYANNPSNKRTPNPIQMQVSLQSNVLGSQGFSMAHHNVGNFNQTYRNNVSKPTNHQLSMLQNTKTPTPSSYDVPSSPNLAQPSTQNNSDLSGSSPLVDQTTTPAPSHKSAHETNSTQSQTAQPSPTATAPQRPMSDEEQQLATKLKETYKNIVNYEEIVQKSCIDLTMKISHNNFASSNNTYQSSIYSSQVHNQALNSGIALNTTELSNDLWTIYHHNVTLLNNYHDFLLTALKPTANSTHFKTGRNIVDLYKIPRRMWVYGIVGFLEVLKNIMSVFQDHEIFLCFIAYCFSIVPNLTDPALEMEGWWCEKLGDLSRMAIALYSSRFIDWKVSAEYWYAVSMKTMYGHGKIYYHMCTVQQDNLDALVNIGKSVICRDPFVPTQQYLRLVVENICTQRNILSLLELPIIDFIKIHKVLLSIYSSERKSDDSSALEPNENATHIQYGIDLVTRYGLTFGCDSHGYNFFTRTFCVPGSSQNKYGSGPFNLYLKQQHEQYQMANSLDAIEKVNFWFNKGALFAIANINHLIGFGDPKNPFAKIFQLPEALKERRDKKDRKRKSKASNSDEGETDANNDLAPTQNNVPSGADSHLVVASELSPIDWFYYLTYLNNSMLELSFRILNYYLIGPKQASTCHVIVWLYFLIAVGESFEKFPNSKPMFLWVFRKFFPWESMIKYLNTLVDLTANSVVLKGMCREYMSNSPNVLDIFNDLEFLPEVWKCWGSLWFDVIAPKGDYIDLASAGVSNYDLFDMPNSGTSPTINVHNDQRDSYDKKKNKQEKDNDERIVRIILLARYVADKFDYGLIRTLDGFKFNKKIYVETETNELFASAAPNQKMELLNFVHKAMCSDGRLVSNEFVTPILLQNLFSLEDNNLPTAIEVDGQWFKTSVPLKLESEENNISRGVPKLLGMEDFTKSDYVDRFNYDASVNMEHTKNLQELDFLHGNQHPQFRTNLPLQIDDVENFDDFCNENYIINGQISPAMESQDLKVDGDLGDFMDTSLTSVVLDTNVWLKHCGRIYKCVRDQVFSVLIPLIVFQELRSLRKSAEATIADAATRSVIIIRELYISKAIVPIRFDGTVASDINETSEFETNPGWMSSVDLTLLHAVNENDEISKRSLRGLNATIRGAYSALLSAKQASLFIYCILITDDRSMRLRAKTSGIASFQSKWLFGQLESFASERCID